MGKFIKYIQLFVVVFNFLFILHEWEEGAYPGGFIDLISSLIETNVSEETKKASRIPTGFLLITFTLMVGICYRDMPKLLKKQLARIRERKP